jgi:paraquat-inducible protein A
MPAEARDNLPAAQTACPQCDLLLREVRADAGCTYVCPRCGAPLYRSDRGNLEKTLALASAALVLLVVANTTAVLGLEINGQRIDTTVFGAVGKLWQEGMQPVAVLVLATTVVAPLLELAGVVWLALPLRLGRRPRAFVRVFRALQFARPWAMPEVLILGMLVAMVKLAHLADLLPGPGIWSFGGLMLLLAALASVVEPRDLWNAWEASRK